MRKPSPTQAPETTSHRVRPSRTASSTAHTEATMSSSIMGSGLLYRHIDT
ncbi:Uncharacterised protein [Mycobacteroides abscessus subsp. abscessus]|nr:Uncharacterised protein [Mycobacteroides abscessus subsp. abscessus]